MSSAPRHVVERQIVDLRILGQAGESDASRAAGLQETVRATVNERLLSALDPVLTSFAGADTTVRLDRIELDLGSIDAAVLGDELVARARERLIEVLRSTIAAILEGSPGAPGHIEPARETQLAAIGHFLETGTLPWWKATGVPGQLLEDFDAVLRESPSDLVTMLRRIGSRRVAVRLVAQFSEHSLRTLVGLLAGRESEALESVIAALAREPTRTAGVTPSSDAAMELRARAIEHLLREPGEAAARDWSRAALRALAAAAAGGDGEPARAAAARIALRAGIALETPDSAGASPEAGAAPRAAVAPAAAASTADLSQAAAATPSNATRAAESNTTPGARRVEPAPSAPTRTRIQSSPETRPLRAQTSAEPVSEEPADPQSPPTDSPIAAPEALVLDSASPHRATESTSLDPGGAVEARFLEPFSDPRPRAALEEGEALTIENAGLVLLWPYLARFLGNLGLTDGDVFVSEAAQQRAVLLLAHTATGENEWPEHALLLDKLLCGWPLEEPLPRRIALTPAEVEESEGLLTAVISNWPILGNTSVAGFREAFLVREGRLALGNDGWQLRVARTGRDVLLDSLPWGVGLVLLPWMEQPLFVEW